MAIWEYMIGMRLLPTGGKEGQVSNTGAPATAYEEQASESLRPPFQTEAAERWLGQDWMA